MSLPGLCMAQVLTVKHTGRTSRDVGEDLSSFPQAALLTPLPQRVQGASAYSVLCMLHVTHSRMHERLDKDVQPHGQNLLYCLHVSRCQRMA